MSRKHDNVVKMTLFEGRNRQIRKMMTALGYRVVDLQRISFAGITMEQLESPGDWVPLTQTEKGLVLRFVDEEHSVHNS